MTIEDHSLAHEFPDYLEQINKLRASEDVEFLQAFDRYHVLDKEIHQIEEGFENTSDEELEKLKYERLHLKDELFQRIRVEAGEA